MLPPEYLADMADDIIALYETYQTALIDDIAKRLVRLGITDTSVWQVQMYQEAGGLYDDAMRHIAAQTGTNQAAIEELFREAGAKAVAYDNKIYTSAGLYPQPLHMSPTLSQILWAGAQKTNGQLRNLTLTTANTAQAAYINAATKAYMQVVNGGMSYQQAIAGAVKDAAHDGLSVLYPSGHGDKLDVSVRRAVLTGVNQTAANMQLAFAAEMGSDLVEVTAHAGARSGAGIADHAGWQGHVYSLSGRHPEYASFYDATGYGEGAGLCGWNCRHNFFPFFEGISTPSYAQQELDDINDMMVMVDGKEIPYYEATQKQRAMERDIRATKRELSALDAARTEAKENGSLTAALDEKYRQQAVKLSKQREALKEFVGQTGLADQKERTQVGGFGRSEAQKAVWAAKGYTGSAESGIIDAKPPIRFADLESLDNAFVKREAAWLDALTQAEKDAVYQYTDATTLSTAVNNAYRNRATLNADEQRFSDALSSALQKWGQADTMVVYRGTNGGEFAGVDVSQLVGTVLKDQGFISTSLLKDSAFERRYEYEITIHQGTTGAAIRTISRYSNEQEFLLDHTMSLRITEVVQDGELYRIKAEVIKSGR